MANVYTMRVVEEGWRNATVKFVGTLDTADLVEVPAITLSTFVNNDKQCSLTGFRVDRVEYSISDGLEMQLEWQGTTPELILPLYGRGKIDSSAHGGLVPDTTNLGYDSTINLRSTNFSPGSVYNFTLQVELVKLYSV
jgi:hypothetical protein